MAKLKIVDKKLDEIREYENNPRRNDKAVGAARKSIEKFGFRNPILLNKDGVIISGHTRIKAAREAGEETVPCIVLDHLTEEEEKAFRLADNRVGEFAQWDDDALLEEMKEIGADDWKDFGFDERDMKGLQAPDECTCPKCGKVFIDT